MIENRDGLFGRVFKDLSKGRLKYVPDIVVQKGPISKRFDSFLHFPNSVKEATGVDISLGVIEKRYLGLGHTKFCLMESIKQSIPRQISFQNLISGLIEYMIEAIIEYLPVILMIFKNRQLLKERRPMI